MSEKFEWQKHPVPVFPAQSGTWMAAQTANPDLLEMENAYYLYFRGQQGGHDRIGLATIEKDKFDGIHWNILPDPVIDVGQPGDWDESHALDPATVRVGKTIFLYYSAVSPTCNRSICLATSTDGVHFEKYAKNPVVIGGGPEIVFYQNLFYLFYWKPRSAGGFELYLATSRNGFRFEEIGEQPVLPAGPPGAWDSHTVETPRIFREGALFYMLYCGSDRFDDYPPAAGLATSRDLLHWEKYSANPIFERGNAGDWDEGAIWFTTVEKINGVYYLWYEGYGGGTARLEPYGSYLQGGKSQVGLAKMTAPYFYVKP